ncbi:MAG: TIGR03936 family radical SAM-associated protein [Gemmataceae bacterium]|nr:TIGR03936 family radical SAM-associated protein [Gemmataceae bacterium]
MVRDKVRIRFRKAGDLRLVSHHDLMRTFERMLRRAALPFHSTAGFNPKPRLIFALSLSLGIVGCREVAELELDEEVAPEEVRRRLAQQAPPGLEILSAQRVSPRTGAQVCRVTYRVPLSTTDADCPVRASRQECLAHQSPLPERVADLLSATELWVDRTRPQPRRFDLRPYLRNLRLHPDALEIELNVTPTGGARPVEVLALLGLDDLVASGAILERTAVELHDENPASEVLQPPEDPEPTVLTPPASPSSSC